MVMGINDIEGLVRGGGNNTTVICSWADECGKKFTNHKDCECARPHKSNPECAKPCGCPKVFGKTQSCIAVEE